MNYLKSFLLYLKVKVYSFIRGLISWKYWPYFLAIVIVCLLVLLVVYLVKRRKASKQDKEPADQRPKEETLPPGCLKKVWREFLREIPREFRRSIMLFSQFIVLGEAGSGKSSLVDTYTDWKGQARQFYPSYTVSPYLQIYLASKALVQEIPPWILNDTSKTIRTALKKLWKPIFKNRDATVVIVLNANDLLSGSPETLKIQAQTMRGKINLLSSIRKRPVKVHIALTHMDKIEGFIEFSDFLFDNGIALDIEFKSQDILKQLPECLDVYEKWIPLALTSLPAEKYMKILAFLNEAPELFPALKEFIQILQATDPLSKKPEITRLYLTSKEQKHIKVSNPFNVTVDKDENLFAPARRHKIIAASLAVLACSYFIGSFIYEHNKVNDMYATLKQVELSPSNTYDTRLHNILKDLSSYEDSYRSYIVPNYFYKTDKLIRQRCINDIRTIYILPKLKEYKLDGNTTNQSNHILLTLSLLYANRHNDLGKLILDKQLFWKENLAFKKNLITDYVNNNTPNKNTIYLNIRNVVYNSNSTIANKLYLFTVYFRNIQSYLKAPLLTSTQLDILRHKAASYLDIIKSIKQNTFIDKLIGLLRKNSTLNIHTVLGSDKNVLVGQSGISNFLSLIKETALNCGTGFKELDLYDFVQYLKAVSSTEEPSLYKNKVYCFTLSGHSFQFRPTDWFNLIKRSELALCIRDYISYNDNLDGMIFFSQSDQFDPILMNPSNNGHFLFTGKAEIEGWFTKNAFQKNVKPVLTILPDFLKQLPVSKVYKGAFYSFVYRETSVYAERYASETANYIKSFNINASSLGALRFVLNQLQLPSSPLTSMLLVAYNNTYLNLDASNPYMRPFVLSLGKFEWVWRLMTEKKGIYPELEKYKSILAQMQMDITPNPKGGPNLPVSGNKTADNTFASLLTPIAKISFAIYKGQSGSYLALTNMWLDSVGIGAPWRHVFLAPIYAAYEIGLKDLKAEVDTVWNGLIQQDILPLYNKFPFNRASGNYATRQDLYRATNIHGDFWEKFNSMLSFLVVRNGVMWSQSNPNAGLSLPSDMLSVLSSISRLKGRLWNKAGAPIPLIFYVKATPLPIIKGNSPIILSYIRLGSKSVFGFNQKPMWQELQFDWWKPLEAFVGVELSSTDRTIKFKELVSVPRSRWSLYTLLLRAYHRPDSGIVYSWPVCKDTYKNTSISSPDISISNSDNESCKAVKFIFKTDPWQLFKLPNL